MLVCQSTLKHMASRLDKIVSHKFILLIDLGTRGCYHKKKKIRSVQSNCKFPIYYISTKTKFNLI